VAQRFAFASRLADLPVLFVTGKGDGLAPSESVFPAFTYWGSAGHDARAVPKLFFLAGRENRFRVDYDGFELLAGGGAAGEVWERVAEWVRE
jgi:hypothetical protein